MVFAKGYGHWYDVSKIMWCPIVLFLIIFSKYITWNKAVNSWFIFPRHLPSASALPDKTKRGNTELASFHSNAPLSLISSFLLTDNSYAIVYDSLDELHLWAVERSWRFRAAEVGLCCAHCGAGVLSCKKKLGHFIYLTLFAVDQYSSKKYMKKERETEKNNQKNKHK